MFLWFLEREYALPSFFCSMAVAQPVSIHLMDVAQETHKHTATCNILREEGTKEVRRWKKEDKGRIEDNVSEIVQPGTALFYFILLSFLL